MSATTSALAADAAPAAAAAAAAAPAAPDNQRKEIFVLGLSYSTRELALARHIETVAPVQDVHILVGFNNRSKGAAFVSLKDPSQVDEVVKKLNGEPLDGRYLDIQRAKPISELPPKPRIIYRPYPAPRYGRGGRYAPPPRTYYSAAPRPRFHQHQREYHAPAPAHKVHQKPEPNPNRTASELTVCVLNLPFVAKETDMEDIFEGFVVLNPKICRTRGGLSKGTAFVTLISHEEQQRAIESIDNVQVEGRQIHISAAYLLPEELEAEKRAVEEYNNKK